MKWGTKLAVAGGFVGAVGLAATAFGQVGSNSSNDAPAGEKSAAVAEAQGRHPKLGRFGRRIVHGEFKVKTAKGFATVLVDTGKVTSVDASKKTLTLKRDDGVSVSVKASDQTRVRKDGERSNFGQIKVGDFVRVTQVNSGDGYVVRLIQDRSPGAQDRRARQTSGDGVEGGEGLAA